MQIVQHQHQRLRRLPPQHGPDAVEEAEARLRRRQRGRLRQAGQPRAARPGTIWAISAASAPEQGLPSASGVSLRTQARRIWTQGQKAGAPSPSKQWPQHTSAPRPSAQGADLLGDPGLADAGLAAQQDDRASPALDLAKLLLQRSHLAVAPDERGARRLNDGLAIYGHCALIVGPVPPSCSSLAPSEHAT